MLKTLLDQNTFKFLEQTKKVASTLKKRLSEG